jgi:16S rRNA (adenine1518-N6/adenine1519-N6)-dimethyltransferase
MKHSQKNLGEDMGKNVRNFSAKKSLGQNFLHAPHIVGKMIHEIGVNASSIVLEVGPGKGVLTRGLLDAGARVIAVEKDDRAIPFLAEKFAAEIASNRLLVIHQDILEFDPSVVGLRCGEYLIAANIPYYITGEFLRKFLETNCAPQKMILMLQKEVAKRIVGENDTKTPKESILSISVKAYGVPKYITTVPARHFRPVPNVDSALILIDKISKSFFNDASGKPVMLEQDFFKIVKDGFAHKRKVLIKNLENLIPRETLTRKWQEIGLSPTIRAENLTLDQWKTLALLLS